MRTTPLRLAALASCALLALSGCSAGQADTTATEAGAQASPSPAFDSAPVPEDYVSYRDVTIQDGYGSGAADGEFPRTVAHAGGSTEIEAEPQRIVVVSGGQLDAVLSLGIVPVGSSNAQDAGTLPDYLGATLAELGAEESEIASVGSRTEPELEEIARLQPDLILGNLSGLEEFYPQLSAIAPTVLTEGAPDNWREDYLLLADALGRQDDARSLLSGLADRAAEAAGDLDGAVVSLVRIQEDRVRAMGVVSTAGMVMAELGLARPSAAPADAVSEDVSVEEADLVDGDVLFYGALGAKTQDEVGAAGESLERTTAWQRDRAVFVDDEIWFQNAGVLASEQILAQATEVLSAQP